ncbi:unnamed protein product [Urochloa humidicola]
MKSRSLHGAAASLIVFFLSIIVVLAAAALVEHTFAVSQMNMTRLCKETVVMVVNGQLPGPIIEVMEGEHVNQLKTYHVNSHQLIS